MIQTYRRRFVIIRLPLHFGLQLTRDDRSLDGYQDGRSPIGRRLHDNVALFVQYCRWNTPSTRLERSAPMSHQMKECVKRQGSEKGQARNGRGQVGRRKGAATARPQLFPHKLAELPVGQSGQSVINAPGTIRVIVRHVRGHEKIKEVAQLSNTSTEYRVENKKYSRWSALSRRISASSRARNPHSDKVALLLLTADSSSGCHSSQLSPYL